MWDPLFYEFQNKKLYLNTLTKQTLIFSKYSFQKTVLYFPGLKQDFEIGLGGVFRIQKMFLMT